MHASMKKLDCLDYYDQIKDTNELKLYEENDEIYAEKHGTWYDKDGVYSNCFEDGQVIDQVQKGDTSSLNKFAQGFNPKTGEQLVDQRAGEQRRPGYDITQSAPKAVSMLWSQASPELRKKIEAALLASAKAGIDTLNKYAAQTVSGAGGKDRIGCHYAAALYMDFTGRPVEQPDGSQKIDPQLHVHCVLPNMTLCEDGKYRAIEGSIIMKAQTLVAAASGARLAEELQKLGFESEHREAGGFGIKGVSEEVCDKFSNRSKQVAENRRVLGIEGPATRGEMQAAKMDGRAHHSLATKDEIEADWKERAEAVDFTPEVVQQLYEEAQARAESPEKPALPTEDDVLEVFDALLETESVMSDAKLRAACLKQFVGRGSLEDLTALIDDTIAKKAVELGEDGPYKMISSQAQIDIENQMVDIAVNTTRKIAFRPEIVDAVIEKFKAEKIAEGKPMSDQQEAAVRFLATDPDAVVAMVGRAGAGKSYTVACLQAIASESGFESTGVALSWAAARNLASEGKMSNAAAIADMAQQLKTGRLKLHDKSMIVIDEAGIVGSRDMHTILTAAKKAGALVVLAGDPLQITSVQAGGALRAIIAEKQHAGKTPFAELTEVRRQRQKWDADAGLALAAGDAQKALNAHIRNGRQDYDGKDLGRIKLSETRDEMIGEVFDQYIKDRFDGTGKSQLVIAQTNADVDNLNRQIHDELKARGVIGEDVQVTGGKDRDKPVQMMLSVGDEIQFRTKSEYMTADNGESVRVFNRTRAKVLEIDGQGDDAKLRVQLFDGDKLSDVTIKISGKDFRGGHLAIEHSYVMTVDSAQGQTFDRSYIFGGDMKDRARAYVAATRHREELSIFCDKDSLHAVGEGRWSTGGYVNRSDMSNELAVDILAQSWSRDREKITTLDYTSEALKKAEITKKMAGNELSRTLAALELQGIQRGRAISLNGEPSHNRIWPQNEHGYIGIAMPSKDADKDEKRRAIQKIDNALVSAHKKFGEIKISGSKEFIDLCARRIVAIKKAKNEDIKVIGTRLEKAIEKVEKAEKKQKRVAEKPIRKKQEDQELENLQQQAETAKPRRPA